ncbi:pullulanase-type alpha-1,6-glucosidase [Acidicapsa acidisoli]|uniref:pullulanase-type alpha-1,6-glucosidase n=1 Tax=Acidicapsa acidisoli TaxID=1615681 RepID=UPI0021E0B6A3|nr:pullulanase-type alpha-1,6-glucosidase [Acidicapsa acidisoli]
MRFRTSIPRLPGKAVYMLALLLCILASSSVLAWSDPAIPAGHIRVHYFRPDGNYSGWTIYAFDNTTENTGNYGGGPVQVTGTDSYGAYFDVGVTTGAQEVGIIIHNPTASGGDQKDTPNNLFVDPSTQGFEYWAYSGIAKLYTSPINLTNPTAILPGYVRVHYHRTDGNYSGWTIYAFFDTTEFAGDYNSGLVPVTNTDSYGAYFDVAVVANAQNLGLIIHNPSASGGDQKDPGPNEFVDPTTEGFEYWGYTGIGKLYKSQPSLTNPNALLPGYARIHYYRPDGNYANWSVYAFNDTAEYTGDYNDGLTFVTSMDTYGAYFDISLIPNAQNLGFIIHNTATGTKDPGPNMNLDVATNLQAWAISGNATVFTSTPTPTQILDSLLNVEQAYWLDRQRVAIQPQFAQSGDTYVLSSSLTGGLSVTPTGITGGTTIPLTAGGTLTADELLRYPQLSGYTVLQLPATTTVAALQTFLQGQLAFSAIGSNGSLQYATGIQDAGVLDDLYYYPGKLGVLFHRDEATWSDWPEDENYAIKLKLWAPTAQSVSLQLFDHEADTTPSATVPMHEHNGVWVAGGDASWKDKYYLYSVKVWVPSDSAVDTNVTSDPYSIDIALNGTKSRITDLDSDETKPQGWDEQNSPSLRSFSDLSLYELHVRDFSINDPTVPAAHRGYYEAFDDQTSNGMKHLRSLVQSGLKAVHILPSFHFASVNEDKSTWVIPSGLAAFPPDGTQQQAAVTASQSNPAYNWGYDPVHYMTPEGSYAINPDNRVREYRVMVKGLHKAGLRVVQDVVFNHTNASGEGPNSNLDEVVPNYYHRLDASGNLETGSCCPDTASEHKMMEKLIIDSLLLNARQYKIDGFRFDILSFMFTYNITDIQKALQALTVEKDGVDGSKIYLYGEGFNFGDTVNNQIGPNASQVNLYGFGVGTFNDRIRDGTRGGSPFTDERVQGFATGVFTDPSDFTNSTLSSSQQQSQLLQYSDWIDVGLTGNLRDFTFMDSAGATVTGAQISYNGQPTGYTKSPIEAVNYASVHDNQDLFDAVQLKSSFSDTIATRARRQIMGMSLITLGQAIPFYQGGDDLLRSKDMDQNSYNSGDWFNKIDWSGQTANWGIGLPIASQNQSQWPIMTPLLSNPAYTPLPANIAYSQAAFNELLQIRYSSDLFHMATLEEIQQNLTFLNTGPSQTPGLIAMKLDANGGHYGAYKHIVVLFNATNASVTFTDSRLQGLALRLHPVQQNSADPTTKLSTFNSKAGTATVPAMTTAVFVAESE